MTGPDLLARWLFPQSELLAGQEKNGRPLPLLSRKFLRPSLQLSAQIDEIGSKLLLNSHRSRVNMVDLLFCIIADRCFSLGRFTCNTGIIGPGSFFVCHDLINAGIVMLHRGDIDSGRSRLFPAVGCGPRARRMGHVSVCHGKKDHRRKSRPQGPQYGQRCVLFHHIFRAFQSVTGSMTCSLSHGTELHSHASL